MNDLLTDMSVHDKFHFICIYLTVFVLHFHQHLFFYESEAIRSGITLASIKGADRRCLFVLIGDQFFCDYIV